MFHNFRRIFRKDENSLHSSSSDTASTSSINPSGTSSTTSTRITNPTDRSTTIIIITDYSFQASDTQGSSPDSSDGIGIFEDLPGLNPSSERIVELQSDIREKLGELMANKSAQDVLVAAEALHGESNDIPFLEHLLDDLNRNGIGGEAYKDALDIAGIVPSPLEQFSILPLIPMKIGNLYFSFTNPSLFMLLTLSLVLLFVHFVTKKGGGNSVPNAWQSLVELIYDFVPNLVNEQIGGLSGNVKQKFFPSKMQKTTDSSSRKRLESSNSLMNFASSGDSGDDDSNDPHKRRKLPVSSNTIDASIALLRRLILELLDETTNPSLRDNNPPNPRTFNCAIRDALEERFGHSRYNWRRVAQMLSLATELTLQGEQSSFFLRVLSLVRGED
ncbi:hypothetical protein A565_p02 (mitochondrion) [Erythranthe guttata]|uniref:F-ATPase protein 6 n=1 Tax=Erythranthe guttata TaxID=4155 RepID=I1T1W6_ERYGU|nr:hypothetical protein OOB38_mgp27 [Erythranthe guttata]AEK26545.1 hypothetical protein [Erythranthe guttata]|eukprot:YP_006460162.1 hypothetical protein A565_p02 (mitochondrion) [Erythranthe guttata]